MGEAGVHGWLWMMSNENALCTWQGKAWNMATPAGPQTSDYSLLIPEWVQLSNAIETDKNKEVTLFLEIEAVTVWF